MKKYKKYLIDMITIFGTNALIYFLSQKIITNYHLMGSALDSKIPFIPSFFIIYTLWYPLVIFTFFVLYKSNRNLYNKTKLTTIISLIILYIIFFAYPTTVNRPTLNSFNTLGTFIAYVSFKADKPVNCFPSGHCLLCFILIYTLLKDNKINLYLKIILICAFTVIIISTLLTKQHVILDVIGSLILSFTTCIIIPKTKYFKNLLNSKS